MKKQAENVGHYVILLVWIAANGLWACGEIFVEMKNDGDKISDDDFAKFNFPFVPTNSSLLLRYFACWTFLLAVACVFLLWGVWFKNDPQRRNGGGGGPSTTRKKNKSR